MQSSDEIKKYSDVVCEQIRWKKAQTIVAVEIENHILDQRDAYLADGDDEATATQKAVKQMGDAVSVGLELDKTHKPKAQWTMITLTAILMLIGTLANSYSLKDFNAIPFVFAFGLFIICYYGDFTLLGKRPTLFYYLLFTISVLALLSSGRINGKVYRVIGGLPNLSLLFPLAAILIFIPTFSGFLLFTFSALLVLCLSIARGWFGVAKSIGLAIVLIPTLIVGALGTASLLQSDRISVILNPYSERQGGGYMYCYIRDTLAEAQFMGKGTIPAIYKGYLPSGEKDYMLTLLTYHLGWIAFISILSIIILFSILGFRHILKQKNMLGTLVAFSTLTTFVIQVLFYTFSNLGYGFFGTLSLPFISYGPTPLFINAALIGFMLSVFRTGDVYRDGSKAYPNHHKLFSYKDGQLIINLKS